MKGAPRPASSIGFVSLSGANSSEVVGGVKGNLAMRRASLQALGSSETSALSTILASVDSEDEDADSDDDDNKMLGAHLHRSFNSPVGMNSDDDSDEDDSDDEEEESEDDEEDNIPIAQLHPPMSLPGPQSPLIFSNPLPYVSSSSSSSSGMMSYGTRSNGSLRNEPLASVLLSPPPSSASSSSHSHGNQSSSSSSQPSKSKKKDKSEKSQSQTKGQMTKKERDAIKRSSVVSFSKDVDITEALRERKQRTRSGSWVLPTAPLTPGLQTPTASSPVLPHSRRNSALGTHNRNHHEHKGGSGKSMDREEEDVRITLSAFNVSVPMDTKSKSKASTKSAKRLSTASNHHFYNLPAISTAPLPSSMQSPTVAQTPHLLTPSQTTISPLPSAMATTNPIGGMYPLWSPYSPSVVASAGNGVVGSDAGAGLTPPGTPTLAPARGVGVVLPHFHPQQIQTVNGAGGAWGPAYQYHQQQYQQVAQQVPGYGPYGYAYGAYGGYGGMYGSDAAPMNKRSATMQPFISFSQDEVT
jgi:hypothetical protein